MDWKLKIYNDELCCWESEDPKLFACCECGKLSKWSTQAALCCGIIEKKSKEELINVPNNIVFEVWDSGFNLRYGTCQRLFLWIGHGAYGVIAVWDKSRKILNSELFLISCNKEDLKLGDWFVAFTDGNDFENCHKDHCQYNLMLEKGKSCYVDIDGGIRYNKYDFNHFWKVEWRKK